ncbi:hydrolase [Cryobacterium zongtaii]|uniref:Hydrolase n=1 Tax=Cryobacterium zongtaii TaxID=1259217 RepID=A0A2S3Z9P7_9MICO|nr:HAD family phosphatase [Cryobacterium zongtaii]POH62276.1 hydrolase [Cryobacterium zongtaii]
MNAEMAAVLWDMDGTIIDSESVWGEAQHRLVAQYGGRWTDADVTALIGSTMEQTVTALRSAGVDLDDDAIAHALETAVINSLREEIVWRPGARELLRSLGHAGIRQAIVTTSSTSLVDVVVRALEADLTFSTVVSGDDVAHGKPHPEPYLTAAARLSVDIADCLAIEDSITGLRAAIASGAVALGVPNDVALEEGRDHALWDTLHGRTVKDVLHLFSSRRGVTAPGMF